MKKTTTMTAVFILVTVILLAFSHRAQAKDDLSQIQKVSYGIGFSIAQKMMADGLQGVDYELFIQGMKDAYAQKEPVIPESVLREAFSSQQKERDEAMKTAGAANLDAAEKFLSENAKKKGVITIEKGLQYKALKSGPKKGKTPTVNSDVVLHYKGTNLSGEEFDSSYKRGMPATMKPSGLIPGFSTALLKMKEGDKWIVYIHPDLAYGSNSPSPKIRPNELLTFEIEVIEVK